MIKIDDILNTIIEGDNIQILKDFPDNCIDLTVTSCPYDNIRNYKNLIKPDLNYNGYSFDFETLAKELYRITKSGGVIVWVVGDQVINGSESGNSFRQALYFKEIGFNIHDTMIYEKYSMSFPDPTRYNQMFEYMFVFSKGKPKTINLIKDHKNTWGGSVRWGKKSLRYQDDRLVAREKPLSKFNKLGVRWNIWKINNIPGMDSDDKEVHYIHPAVFPEALAKDHILTWSSENDVILDPFSGSGTVAKMASKTKRKYIGIDINPVYVEYSKKRINNSGGYSTLDELFGDQR
jgi:site-specific DNA-methyltransferase (adenine-specific)